MTHRSFGATPNRCAATRIASGAGLPSARVRVPVILSIAPAMAQDVPRLRPFAEAK